VVGCDGIRSFNPPRPPGLPFPRRPEPGARSLLADLILDGLPMTDAYGDLSDRGMLLVFPVPGRLLPGWCSMTTPRAEVPVEEPVHPG